MKAGKIVFDCSMETCYLVREGGDKGNKVCG